MGKPKHKHGSATTKCPKKAGVGLIVWVVRADDKKLIPGVSVTIAGPTNQSQEAAGGVGNFDPIDAGKYTVSVSLAGNQAYKDAIILGKMPREVTVQSGVEIVEIEVGPEPIKIVLVDTDGIAVPDEPFELTTPDGRLMKGKLNKKGEAIVRPILPGGDCRIRFPKRHSDFWKFEDTSSF